MADLFLSWDEILNNCTLFVISRSVRIRFNFSQCCSVKITGLNEKKVSKLLYVLSPVSPVIKCGIKVCVLDHESVY